MSSGPDDPGKQTTQKSKPPRHDLTGGPMTGSMVDHDNYAWKRIKANQAERDADKQRHDRAALNSEPTRPGQQQQPGPLNVDAGRSQGLMANFVTGETKTQVILDQFAQNKRDLTGRDP